MKTIQKTVLIAVLFAASTFVLVGKLIQPSQIQVIIQGDTPTVVGQILSYTQIDVIVISVSAIMIGVSGPFLLLSEIAQTTKALPTAESIDYSEMSVRFALRLLDGDRRKILSEVVESQGEITQSELGARTGFSKVKVSRILDSLEEKGLIIRMSHGMTNKIIMKRDMLELPKLGGDDH